MPETEFSNSTIIEKTIPNAEGLVFEELADNYTRTLRIEFSAIVTLIFIINLIGNSFGSHFSWLITQWWLYTIFVVLMAGLYFLAPKIAQSKGYALREKDIHYKSGLIWKKTTSLPFNRIQHVELESGPLERLFKLTTLKFFSAGGGKTDMKIPALPFERSKKLREFIIKKAGVEETSKNSQA